MHSTGQKETQRIAKLLARAGVASRREIERMIAEGRVAIDGVVIDTPATLLTSLRGVTVDGNPVKEATPARLFLFHKPSGVLTAANDPKGRRTIYDVLPRDLPRLMPVGRLDLNTEGLLLLTTDGELKRQLELPATGVERAYRARAYGEVSQAQLEDLIDGIEIDGVRYGSIDANLERRTGANVWIEMVLTEGKNREVRRVLEHLGLRVSRLIRTRYGPFVIGDLPAGGIGEVRAFDLINFRASLKGNKAKAVEDARAQPIAVTGEAKQRRIAPASPPAAPARSVVEPDGTRKARALAPRKREVREDIDTRPQRPQRTRAAGPAVTGRGDPAQKRSTATAGRSERTGRPVSARGPAARKEGIDREAAPRPGEVREDLTTRPRNARPGPLTEPPDPKPRPKRGAGWAKAKPKPGARPGKPRKPR
ncbi:pseudouridine synthase [Sphingomonas sp.]|uniref:pseudouridine synthase n=1 Tax=Sphingomonas sp. TaxID=28214 RepID=UPI002DD63961|nr:pseudouridine synthase [Sphingomonas sp.]